MPVSAACRTEAAANVETRLGRCLRHAYSRVAPQPATTAPMMSCDDAVAMMPWLVMLSFRFLGRRHVMVCRLRGPRRRVGGDGGGRGRDRRRRGSAPGRGDGCRRSRRRRRRRGGGRGSWDNAGWACPAHDERGNPPARFAASQWPAAP